MSPTLRQHAACLQPSQTYFAIADAGHKKLRTPICSHLAAAIFGGVIIAAYGHCATLGSSKLIEWIDPQRAHPASMGTAALAYSLVFSGAFAGIIATGSDLFTSNVMYVTAFLLTHPDQASSKSNWFKIVRMFTTSYVGNMIGTALIGATVFSLGGDYLGGAHYASLSAYNHSVNHGHELICQMARSKMDRGHPIHSAFCNAIGCNFFVTLATWKTKYAQEALGQYVGALMPVVAFCVGGFQHIIANMYTLAAAYLVRCQDVTLTDIIVRNILPVTLGNIVGGVFVALLGYGIHGVGDGFFGVEAEVYTVQNAARFKQNPSNSYVVDGELTETDETTPNSETP